MDNFITKEVRELKERFSTSDPFDLIEMLGIHVMYKSGLGSLKGFYYTLFDERYIVLNDDIGEELTVIAAHELGHDRLHRHLADVPLKDYGLFPCVSTTEHQANIFAAELLISDEEVTQSHESDFASMCAEIGFPPEFVAFKLYAMIQRGHNYSLPENLKSGFLK